MLTDVATFKLTHGVTSGDDDRAIRHWLLEAESLAEGYTRRSFEVATYTEYFDGGQSSLFLAQWPVVVDPTGDPSRPAPVVSIDSDGLYGGGTYGTDSLAVAGTDYVLLPDGELRWLGRGDIGGCCGWPAGSGNVRIVYWAGYTACTAPEELKEAIMEIAAGLRLQAAQQSASIVQQTGGTGVAKQVRRGQAQVTYFSPSELSISSAATISTSGSDQSAAPSPWKTLDRYRKVVVA